MAEELRHVDGHRDIHQMHQSAVHSLSLNADTADMIPEYRDSLRKCLLYHNLLILAGTNARPTGHIIAYR